MQSCPELPIDDINMWEVMHRNSLRMISIWPSLYGVRHQSGCRAFQVKFYRISCQRSIFLFFLFFLHIYLIRCWVTSRKQCIRRTTIIQTVKLTQHYYTIEDKTSCSQWMCIKVKFMSMALSNLYANIFHIYILCHCHVWRLCARN